MNKSLLSQKYVPLHKLNEGHMGEVFLARQTGLSGFQREVVLRHIHAKICKQPKAAEIFLEEIQFALQLSHANIVHIYDVVEDEGSYSVVMERIKGASLSDLRQQVTRRGKMIPLGLSLNIVAQMLEGLRYAHSFCDESGRPLKIIHRGICPTNVRVSFFGNVKLFDFGLARANDQCRDEADISPESYEYMSPEVVSRDLVDQRSDLFNVGILLYELTVGQRLFRASTFEGMKKLIDKPIAPPTYARDGYPADLENIVMRALERDPADRFDDAEEMLEQLEQFTFNAGLRFSRLRLGQFITRLMGVSTQKPFPEEELELEEGSVPIAEELGFDGKGIFQKGGGQKTRRAKRRKRRRRQQEVERLAQEAIAELVPSTDHEREDTTMEIPAVAKADLVAKSIAPLTPLSESTMVVTDEQVEEEIDLPEDEPILQPKRSLFEKETVVQYVSEKPDGQVTVRVTSMQPRGQGADAAAQEPEGQEEVTQRKGPPDPSPDLKAALAEISTDLKTGEESDRRRIEALEHVVDEFGDETVVPLSKRASTSDYETGPAAEQAEYLLVKKTDGTGASTDGLELIDGGSHVPDELEQADLEPYGGEHAKIPAGKIISPIKEESDVELELDGETIILDGDESAIEVIADEDLEEIDMDGLEDQTVEMPPPPMMPPSSERAMDDQRAAPVVGQAFIKPRPAEPGSMQPRVRRSRGRPSGQGRAKAAVKSRATFKRSSKKSSSQRGRKPNMGPQRKRPRR